MLSSARNSWIIARNEFHIRWGSISTWVFFSLVTLVFCLAYIVEIKEFYDFWSSGYSFDIPIGPKYFLPSLLTWYLVLTTLGAIYLGANLRTEHIQNRINEVVESRPVSNLELASGRLFSFTVLMSIPVVFSLIFVSLYGYIDNLFGLGYGDSPEVWSALAFVVWDIVPNLAIWGAFAMFLTAILRSRLAGAMSTCLIFVGWCVLTFGLPLEVFEQPLRVPSLTLLMQAAPVLPLWLLESLQSFSAAAMFPSELAPTLMSGSLVVQRFAMLLIAVALVCGAAMFFPRSQESKKTGSIVGIACVLIATTLLGTMSYRAWHSTEQTSRWAQTHNHLEASENLDLEHISGSVELRPGRFMSLDLTLRLRTRDTLQTEEGVFAFNPDFRIKELWLNGTEIFDYDFQDGLLTVPWDSKATTVELRVLARGKPKESFAYMDASINVAHLNGKQLRRLRNLGTKSSIFHSDFVALLPGVHWYPTPGAATGRDDLDNTATDFFTFDLEVSTKRNWLVASTGQRQRLPDKAPSTYRMHSLVPVPSIAIVSSSFVRRSISVEGIEFELLFSQRHESKFEHLAGIEIDLQDWLTERLTHAKSLGLEYPYKRFTVVVVPSTLRIFGGGWQMDSTLSPPGMFLVRESGILSVRYERDEYRYVRWDERVQRKKYVLSSLLNKLRLDLVSENPYVAFSKNFLTNQTKPTGSGAVALQFILDRIVSQSVMELDTYFSIQDLLVSDLQDVHFDLWWGKEFAGKYFDQPSVWFSAESISLRDLEMLPDPHMRNKVLWHKGYAIIRTLRDHYDSNELGTIFWELLDQCRGRTFSFEDLVKLTPPENEPISAVIGDLLYTTSAPGYITSPLSVSPVDIPLGTDEYLTSFVLYNEQESPGFIRIYDGDSPIYELEGDGVITDPIWFGAKQAQKISIRSSQPYQRLDVKPYFSLNREYLPIYPTPPDQSTQWINEAHIPPIVEPINWQPSENEPNTVVVDDLDLGFSIVRRANLEQVQPIYPRIVDATLPTTLSHKQYYLPEFPDDYRVSEWHRVKDSRAFGRYRPTYVRVRNGRGNTSARFDAELPKLGTWRLEYHVEKSDFPENFARGWYDITIVTERYYPAGDIAITVKNGIDQTRTEFGFTAAEKGWQLVGDYEIVENTVAVLVSDATIGNTGTTVHADAIRWTYLDEKTSEESAQK